MLKASVFVLAFLVSAVGQYYRGTWIEPNWPTPCVVVDPGPFPYIPCSGFMSVDWAWAIISLGMYLYVAGAMLLLADEERFCRWLKFSVCYLPCAVILDLVFWPTSGLMFLSGPVPRSAGVYPLSHFFLVATAYFVFWPWVVARNQENAKQSARKA